MCCLGHFNRLNVWQFIVIACGYSHIVLSKPTQGSVLGTQFNSFEDDLHIISYLKGRHNSCLALYPSFPTIN